MAKNPRITDVEAVHLRLPDFDESRTDSSRDALVVLVHTDTGITGVGEVDSSPLMVKAAIESPASHPISRGLREVLLGQNPLDVRRLWHEMYQATLYHGRGGALVHAMAGIDIALWDIAGKVLDRPVCQLLGGAHRSGIRGYASNMFQATPELTAARAAQAVEAGFTAVKFGWEPFGRDPDLDVALTAAVRDTVGNRVGVALDAGLAWDARTALSRIALLERFDLMWIEEPLHPDDLTGYRKVTERSTVPVAAGEQESTRAGFRRLMDEGRIDLVQIDVTRTGLTQALLIAGDAAERGLPVANHTFTTDINAAASLHLLAAAPNARIFEYGVEPGELSRRLVRNPVRFVDGRARIPTGPGLGIDLDLDVVERHRWTA
jgi:L-alanine-DL-glutamate epimerase-like enolase superfamily enzyme